MSNRRFNIAENTPLELKIRECMKELELMGADIRLTNAVVYLDNARVQIADFIDEIEPKVIDRRIEYTNT